MLTHTNTILDKIPAWEWYVVIGGLIGFIVAGMYIIQLTTTTSKAKSRVWTWSTFWLVLSGVIHLWLEGNFVFWREDSMISNAMELYAAADFRYGRPLEYGTAAMEAITAVVLGPMCLLLAYARVHRVQWRWPLQVALSTCQIYGLVWFILHTVFSPEVDMTEDPFLFWTVAFGMNMPWGVIPPVMLYEAWQGMTHIPSAADSEDSEDEMEEEEQPKPRRKRSSIKKRASAKKSASPKKRASTKKRASAKKSGSAKKSAKKSTSSKKRPPTKRSSNKSKPRRSSRLSARNK